MCEFVFRYKFRYKMSNDWSNGLCSCFEDCSTCKHIINFRVLDYLKLVLRTVCIRYFDLVINFAGIISYFCPCYIFGKNAEQLGESCVMYALSQFVPLLNLWCRTQVRGKIREQKGIEGTCIKDLLMVWCCPLCSLVQEARVCVSDCTLQGGHFTSHSLTHTHTHRN